MNGYSVYIQGIVEDFDPLDSDKVEAQRAMPEINRLEFNAFEEAMTAFQDACNDVFMIGDQVAVLEDLEGVNAGRHYRYFSPAGTETADLIPFFRTDYGMGPAYRRVLTPEDAVRVVRDEYTAWAEQDSSRSLDAAE